MNLVECRYTAGDNVVGVGTDVPRWVDPASGTVYEDRYGTRRAYTNTHHPRDGVYETGLGSVLTPIKPTASPAPGGQKFDGDKDEPSLLMQGCSRAVAGIVSVLSFGFQKYKQRNGWKEVPEAKRRYKDALYRHMAAFERGELLDPESGRPHLDHVACNSVFLSELHHAEGAYSTPPIPVKA